jgi:seryl-tRNA synthetase
MSVEPISLHQNLTAPEEILSKLFRPTGVDGVHLRTGAYEDVVEALSRYITGMRPAGAEVYRFPPVVSRKLIEKSGYLKSFPNLLGCVCALSGDEAHIEGAVERFLGGGEAWTRDAEATELLLAPAACYPVYEIASHQGTPPAGGFIYDVASDCFRREPSKNIDRLQSFRMREFVAVGAPEDIREFRDHWMARAPEIAGALGVSHRLEAASDPFFGRAGQLVSRYQVAQSLKFEMLIPVRSAEQPTACMSFNYHREHFGEVWGIATEAGEPAHTACVAFGMDRLAVALFAAHGVEVANWPDSVKAALKL